MVGVTDGRKRHPASARPHGHAQSVARRFRGRRGVTHHQTFSLQHYRFCVILAADLGGPPKNQEQQSERDRAARKGGRAQTRHSSNVPASCRCSFLWWLAGVYTLMLSAISHIPERQSIIQVLLHLGSAMCGSKARCRRYHGSLPITAHQSGPQGHRSEQAEAGRHRLLFVTSPSAASKQVAAPAPIGVDRMLPLQ